MRSGDEARLGKGAKFRPLFTLVAALAFTFVAGGSCSMIGPSAAFAAQESPANAPSASKAPAAKLPLPDFGSGRDAAQSGEADEPADDNPASEESVTKPGPALPVHYDLSKLPEPVRRMRQLIIDAAKTGDLEKLRPLLGKGPTATQLAISGYEGDPIAYLHSLSGDPGGQEILAILLDVLDAGYVDMDPGTPEEAYVWPYFFARPLDNLTAPQRVELFRIITAGDFAEMKETGGYSFFRVGISPDGEWRFFVAGN